MNTNMQTQTKNLYLSKYQLQIEKYLYKEIAKNLNNIYEQDTTASLAVGLFLKLPIRINLVQNTNINYNGMDFFSAYTKIGNEAEVFIDLFYKEESDEAFQKLLRKLEETRLMWAYIYQHELMHIMFKHVTTSFVNRMKRIGKEVKPDITEHSLMTIINMAEDYFINYCIKDIANNYNGFDLFITHGLYNAEYHRKRLSDIDILKDLLKNANSINISDLLESYKMVQDANGNTIIKPKDEGQATSKSDENNVSDAQLVDLAQTLNTTIQSQAKGSQAASIVEQVFNSIKVNTDWFNKIRTSFKRIVYYMTHDYYTKWTSLNMHYRHVFKSPKKYFLDNKIEIVLSIDQSGSMPQDSLQKLLYLMEQEGKKVDKLTVLIHDIGISKEFILQNEYDINKHPQFKKALATRYQSGGTSHRAIFQWLQNNIKDPSKTIYMSFSDNYSDIKEIWNKFPVLRKTTNYLVCPINNPIHIPVAIDILME